MGESADLPLVVASNRGPLSFTLGPDGAVVPGGTAGGLAGSLHDLVRGSGATWVACAMSEADRAAVATGAMHEDGLRIVTVAPDESQYAMAYDTISNATLWFVHHHLYDLARRPRFDRRWQQAWDAYRDFNQTMADAICASVDGDAVALVHDYHLSLVPAMVRARRPEIAVAHFSHTPFADPGLLRVLPDAAADELLRGLAGASACGFHTERWAANFRACCADHGIDPPRTFASPLSPDPEQLAARAASDGCRNAIERIAALAAGRRIILRVDRVELSKNLARGFWAFDDMLERHPEHRGTVVFLALAYPSRQGLPEYLAYRAEVEQTAAMVNERWATDGWTPVILDIADDADRSFAALTQADVLLVNPVRDGLNLVAKEGPLVNERDGLLVLSREAGAADELDGPALMVNPFDIVATSDALHRALVMPVTERAERAADLRRRSLAHPPRQWLDDQVAAALASRSPRAGTGS
jgi:trehalose 6-phosphate synthase